MTGQGPGREVDRGHCTKCAADWIERVVKSRRSRPPTPGCGPNPPSRYQRELFRRIDAGEKVSLGRGVPF